MSPANRSKQRERSIDESTDVRRLREGAEHLLREDEAEGRHADGAPWAHRRPASVEHTIDQGKSDRQPHDGGDDTEMLELAGDVARAGEGQAGQDCARPIGAKRRAKP